MKLYFSPGACSLAPHIVARELGLDLEIERVDLAGKKTASGEDFWAINPKGYVPALRLDDGQVLTENPAVLQYLAERGSGLVPPAGSFERSRLTEMLAFINSEIHKTWSALFNPKILPEVREERIAHLKKRYQLVEQWLTGKQYLLGDQFTVADAYLYVVTSWATMLKVDLGELPALKTFVERVGARPAVQAARKAESGAKA